MIFSLDVALTPGLRVFDLLKHFDLEWMLTRPKKPLYQTRLVSLAVVRTTSFGVESGVCICSCRVTDMVGAVMDVSSIVVACTPPELETLM